MKIKSFKFKSLLFIAILLIYFLYIFRDKFSTSPSCSYLYNSNSFQICASSNKTCNITLLINSYIAYRACVIKHSSTDADYVVFDAVNGLGNRVLGLIAVTTYALVTSRIVLINWQPGDNHQAYFKDIFLPLSSSDETSFLNEYSLSRLVNLLKNRWINEIQWKSKTSRIPRDWAFYFDRDILCDDKTSGYSWFVQFGFSILNFLGQHVRWIRTDQYFVPLLTRNEKTRQAFMTLFQDGQVFTEIASRILRPVPKVDAIIQDFQTRYNFQSKTITIGVHMRSWSSSMPSYIEPFQKCIEHVIQNMSRSSKEEIKVALYIISNTPKRRQQLENQILKTYKTVEILNPPEAPSLANAAEKMQYTLAELLILSKMQHLIITSKSTFGMVAQGLAHKGAWVVRQGAVNELQTIKLDLCEWEWSSEPEYQMMGSLEINDDCKRHGASLPSIGERTIL